MTFLEMDAADMKPWQLALWWAICGCNVAEIAAHMAVPEREVMAVLSQHEIRYDPIRRPV